VPVPEPVAVLVVQHEPACPPAHLGHWLADAGCRLDVRRPYAGDELPGLDGYAGLLVLGGSMGANDDADHAWLAPVKQLVRDAAFDDVPTLGVCLGHQLVATALGGMVRRNPLGQQVGLADVGWLAEAREDELFAGLATPRRAVFWNHDLVVELPADAVVLAETERGEPQAVRFATTVWGVQFHPEADEKVVAAWAEGDRDEHEAAGIDPAKVLAGIAEARPELDRAWQPLADRFAAIVRSGS
jgi:GMP synthase (glutamine-hydrolysing)